MSESLRLLTKNEQMWLIFGQKMSNLLGKPMSEFPALLLYHASSRRENPGRVIFSLKLLFFTSCHLFRRLGEKLAKNLSIGMDSKKFKILGEAAKFYFLTPFWGQKFIGWMGFQQFLVKF